VPIIRVAAE
jgi:hypothetical protein